MKKYDRGFNLLGAIAKMNAAQVLKAHHLPLVILSKNVPASEKTRGFSVEAGN